MSIFNKSIDSYFTPNNWRKMSISKKEKIIIKLFKKIKEELPNNCSKILFEDFDTFCLKGLFSYEYKSIHINKELLTDSFSMNCYIIYNILYHEMYHSYQNRLIEENNSSKTNEILQLNYKFYINDKLSYLYILDYNNLFQKNKDLASCIYVLCSLEREAFDYGYRNVMNIYPNYNDIISEKILYFCNYYNISLTNNEIFNLIDTCYLNIYNHKEPSNDIEATIMYDICILALYQGQSLTEMEVMNYLNKENKQKILEEQGFNIYTNPFKASNSFIKKYNISALSKEELKDIITQMNYSQRANNSIFLYKANKILKDNYKVNDNDIDTDINQEIEAEIEFEER